METAVSRLGWPIGEKHGDDAAPAPWDYPAKAPRDHGNANLP
ncbi:hypothetical protein thalar_01194 [Litoreibacter arenae DSM 19593]|uniref:Uncharacterized protein n=1 Tax=Litoreibacter arenae DSM 19593 TaxID=1123360 RepID=S9QJT3_9RHOB|nr:hypothetical protein thalar_01194 [Litoreibacter arenae DSM 19593]